MPEPAKLALRKDDVIEAKTPDGKTIAFSVRSVSPQGPALGEAVSEDGKVAVVKGPPTVGGKDAALDREDRHLALVSPHESFQRLLGKAKDKRGHTLYFFERLFENPFLALNREAVRARLKDAKEKEQKTPPKTGTVGKARRIAPPISVALELAYELALALEHLHLKGIVHGDVRPRSLLVAIDWREPAIPDSQYFERIARGRWRGVLAELGGSRTGKELDGLARGLPLVQPPSFSPLYSPPEVLPGIKDAAGNEKARFGAAMDSYAFGLTLVELLTGSAPYSHLRFPPEDSDADAVAQAKRAERNGENKPYLRSVLDSLEWQECEIVTGGREIAAERQAFQDEIWDLVGKATQVEHQQRARMADLRALLAKILKVDAVNPQNAAQARDAQQDDPRTWRSWEQKRLRLDAFSSKLAFAGRDGTSLKQDPKTLKIQRRGDDFWERQGMAPK